jgi:hypothetical protein
MNVISSGVYQPTKNSFKERKLGIKRKKKFVCNGYCKKCKLKCPYTNKRGDK